MQDIQAERKSRAIQRIDDPFDAPRGSEIRIKMPLKGHPFKRNDRVSFADMRKVLHSVKLRIRFHYLGYYEVVPKEKR